MTNVSVVMSAYNAEAYVGEAVESILGQTFRDFELIVVDDGSTDGTPRILDTFHDPRIIRLRNEGNVGLTRSLNRGLRRARGQYIARLDADDIALPARLERQVTFLDKHPHVGLIGGAVIYIAPDGKELGIQRVPAMDIRQALLDVEFCWWHSTVAFRSKCLRSVGYYREEFEYAQDYDLWLRMAEKYDLASLIDPLVKLRLRPQSISIAKRSQQRAYVMFAVELAKQRATAGQDTLDAVFNGVKDAARDHLPTLAPEELGQINVRAACLNYLVGNISDAKEVLAQAIHNDPTLVEETGRLVQRIVSYGFNYASSQTSRTGAVRFLRRVFANLPPAAEALVKSERKAIGRFYAMSAFESHQMSCWRKVLGEMSLALIYDPTLLKYREVWSIFLRAIAGVVKLDGTLPAYVV